MKKEPLTLSDVKRIAALARLKLSPAQLEQTQRDLAGILTHFAQIQKINTTNVPTSDDVTNLKNVTRVDEVEKNVLASPTALLDAAPSTERGYVKVKAIFD